MTENALTNQKATLPAVPDYLKVDGDTSTEGLKQYIRPNRIKILQSQSNQELLDAFGVGDVIVVPDNLLVMAVDRDSKGNANVGNTPPFLFTPIFFYSEFCTWNDYKAKGTLPAIQERSFDKNSKIAMKARDFSCRVEQSPDNPDWKVTHCEHLNFIIMTPGQIDPCVLTFSKGEFKSGINFAGLTKLRRGIPLYGNIFAAHLGFRSNDQGKWYGLDISNPDMDDSPYVGEEAFQAYRIMHEEFKELHGGEKIVVDYEEEPIDVDSGPSASM